jgi:hypothetical protein
VSLGRAHELAVAASASVAFLLALLGGELSVFAWAVLLAPWLSLWLRERERQASALSGTVVALASLGLGVATLLQRGAESAVLAGGYALTGLLVARLLTRATLAHDLQALLLSLLLVIAGGVLNVKLSYGPLFLAYGVAIIWALITRELLAGAERASLGDVARNRAVRARKDVVTGRFLVVTSGVAVSVLLCTSVLFVLFPRVGFGSLSLGRDGAGRLPPSVSLRGSPRAGAGGREVVARVSGVSRAAFERGLYLRGAVYEVVGEYGFSQAEPAPKVKRSHLQPARALEETAYEVSLSPGAGDTLFTLGDITATHALAGGSSNPSFAVGVAGQNRRGELTATSALHAPFRYRIHGGVASPVPPAPGRREGLVLEEDVAAVFLALPDDLEPRLKGLAGRVVGDAQSARDKANRLRTFLLTSFTYTLDQPNAGADKPLAAFLLSDPRGHCEYFAAAHALLLRLSGVPTRVVGGYQGGMWDSRGDIVVFQGSNAHAWVEWFEPGTGWVTDDPTPLASAPRAELRGLFAWLERAQRLWDDSVLDYAFQDQKALAQTVREALAAPLAGVDEGRGPKAALGVLGLLALVLGALRLARRRAARRLAGGASGKDALGAALFAALERCGGAPVPATATAREALFAARERLPAHERALLERAVGRYEERRFSKAAPSPGDEELQASLARLPAGGPSQAKGGGLSP